jgi:hypothetical protein
MMARSPRSSAPVTNSRMAVDLLDPVVPKSLKCLVSSIRGISTPASVRASERAGSISLSGGFDHRAAPVGLGEHTPTGE